MKRNLNSLLGYTMKGTDGEIGKVRDFYFDDETWDIRHVILKTGSWFSSRDVLISPRASQLGHVVVFILDDQTWKILCLAIDTHHWIGGQKVLLPVRNIKGIQWENSSVYVDEKMGSIKTSPCLTNPFMKIPKKSKESLDSIIERKRDHE